MFNFLHPKAEAKALATLRRIPLLGLPIPQVFATTKVLLGHKTTVSSPIIFLSLDVTRRDGLASDVLVQLSL